MIFGHDDWWSYLCQAHATTRSWLLQNVSDSDRTHLKMLSVVANRESFDPIVLLPYLGHFRRPHFPFHRLHAAPPHLLIFHALCAPDMDPVVAPASHVQAFVPFYRMTLWIPLGLPASFSPYLLIFQSCWGMVPRLSLDFGFIVCLIIQTICFNHRLDSRSMSLLPAKRSFEGCHHLGNALLRVLD